MKQKSTIVVCIVDGSVSNIENIKKLAKENALLSTFKWLS